MLDYVIVGLLVVILLGLLLLGISLKKRKEAVEIDLTKLSEGISSKIKEDVSKAVRETVSEVSERVGGVSGTLKSVVELFEKIRSELPKDVKEPVNEVLERALRDLKEFDKNIAEMGNELPNKVLRSIQSGISVRKGKVGELTTLMRILAAYKRIIPLGQPIDFIGISDEYVDFIEVKTGTSGLTREEREIKGLIEEGKVRFILKREEVEITTPGKMEELTGGFAKEDADAIEKTGNVKEGETKGEIYICLNCGEPLSGEFDVCPYCGEPLIKQSGREENKGFDGKLFGKLMKLRAVVAKEESIARGEDVPSYQLFYPSTLKEIATKVPTTKEDLRHIKWIGEYKLEKYGERVLNVIKDHFGVGKIYESSEELKPENQNHVRDFVSASEIYEKMETKTYDNELFEKLRKLRTGIAREEKVEPFFVFHNSVLKEIATKIPTTKEELLLIKGIGDKKIDRYGERILNVIDAHISERK